MEERIMNKYIKLVAVVFTISMFSGCSIKHVVSNDYQKYLKNNEGSYKFPKTTCKAQYILTQNTIDHNYKFRSAMVGSAHVWVVKFGEMLEKTLESKDVKDAFTKLSKVTSKVGKDTIVIKYDLIDYKFKGFEARVKLKISVLKNDSIVFEKEYYEKGISQGGKMFFAGSFGMKNAIQQSTKSAIDKIFNKFLLDINSKNICS